MEEPRENELFLTNLVNTRYPTASRDYQCEWCAGPIRKGYEYKEYIVRLPGKKKLQSFRVHFLEDECRG